MNESQTMMERHQVDREAASASHEIEALRASVSWGAQVGYERILAGSYRHFCIRRDSRLVGFLNVISDGILDALPVDLMVHPEDQKQGLGPALMTEVIASLSDDAIRYIQVIFTPERTGFYRRCGFPTFSLRQPSKSWPPIPNRMPRLPPDCTDRMGMAA